MGKNLSFLSRELKYFRKQLNLQLIKLFDSLKLKEFITFKKFK